MARTRSTIVSLVHSKLAQSSVSLSETNINNTMNLALDRLLLDVDFPETEKTSSLTPIFDRVTSYAPPSDMKGDSILGIRPYPSGDRTVDLSLRRVQTERFDQNYFWDGTSGVYAIEYNHGTKILRLQPKFASATNYTLHNCNAYDNNGTWTAGAGAGSVATDDGVFVQGSGSVKWTASANTTVVNNSTFTAVDISDSAVGKSYVFCDLYLPSTTTSVTIKWGSDSSNYFSNSATTQFVGSAFTDGWNTIGVAYEGATETGTVDTDNIDFVEISITGTGFSGEVFRVDDVALRDGDLYEIKYYTKNAVSSNAGTKQQYFTADDDYLICNEEGEAVFVDYLAAYLAPNAKEPNGQTFMQIAQDAIRKYNARYPSKRKITSRQYYKFHRGSVDTISSI